LIYLLVLYVLCFLIGERSLRSLHVHMPCTYVSWRSPFKTETHRTTAKQTDTHDQYILGSARKVRNYDPDHNFHQLRQEALYLEEDGRWLGIFQITQTLFLEKRAKK
jgi:hypothetical protein